MADTDRQTVGRTQSNAYVLLGTARTSHNKQKALLDTADRVQYSHADAYGVLVTLPAPKVSETGGYISYSINLFSSNRDNTVFHRQRTL